MSTTDPNKVAALIVAIPFAAAAAVVLIWWFAAQVHNLRRRTDEDAADGDLTAVIPWADLTQPRRLPDWVDEPSAYFDEFLMIADTLPDLDETFLAIVANPEETR